MNRKVFRLKNMLPRSVMKIVFFSSFCSSEACRDTFIRVNELNKDPNYGTKYIFVGPDEEYTHAIIINTAMPKLKVPPQNVIGLAFEPTPFLGLSPEFIAYAQHHISRYYLGSTLIRSGSSVADSVAMRLPETFVEHFGYQWHTLPMDPPPLKTLKMSIMVSDKCSAPGHIYRHQLVQKILASDLPIDIWGRGCKFLQAHNDIRIRGEFNNREHYQNYQYHIAIENFSLPHYFSEKVMDPLLCNTIPIYHGCTAINEYFPNMVIGLSGQLESDFSLLKDICSEPNNVSWNRLIDLDKVRSSINIANVIDSWNC